MKNAAKISQKYRVECHDRLGNLKWVEGFDNLVVTVGLNEYLNATLAAQTQHTAWYVGLKGTGTVVNGDTLASHAGWSEINPYSGDRPAWTPGAVSGGSVDNSASKAVYSITAALTVYGAFMCTAASGTSGVLLGAGDFGTPRAVEIGDTLSVTVTCSITAS
jgi:hypothetical protein